ncbi:MAG TPA: NAD(P)/FAD-dependent oxidoreductase [Bdellovibrionota bacterium]|nr:NAD(P)/FAD-dependent oxidoreductase [Bdellovibrionota bacterium]
MTRSRYDAIVVGSGPNGLAAAVTLAQAGKSVLVREAMPTPGGGTRTEELTLPGFKHDVCSAAHPLGAASPYFRSLPLAAHGLQWIRGPHEVAHPLENGESVTISRSLEETAARLGEDERAYLSLYGPIARHWDDLGSGILGPMIHLPKRPVKMALFGLKALRPAASLARAKFRTEKGRALFAGIAAHSSTPLEWHTSAAIGIVLGALAHVEGWPVARGGSRAISDALISYLKSLGGELEVGSPVTSLRELPESRHVLFDLPPRLVARIAGDELPESYRRKLERFKPGPGVFKLDWALDGPIPWSSPEVAKSPTVHLGGTLEEISLSERGLLEGRAPEKPYVLLTQASLFDPTRAPAGKHTAWAYCHVPNGWTEDMTARIEAQIERYAPGFGKRVLARSKLAPKDLEARNPNLLGGDITGGMVNLAQVLARPSLSLSPYRTPNERIFICSSSTPPGPAVHGMCGHRAAVAVLAARKKQNK